MAFPERRTVDILLTTALLTAAGVAVYRARRVILMCVFAILFTYLIDPVVMFCSAILCFSEIFEGRSSRSTSRL
jgi:predicted PurR-regulated permease PerM